MEAAPVARDLLEKVPWYKKTAGEVLLVVLLVIAIGVLAFFSAVAKQVYVVLNTKSVQQISGTGSLSVTTQAGSVSDAANVTLLENAAMSLGSPDAALTIVEFADFGCPFSEQASRTMRELAAKYPNRFHYVYKDFPITELHPDAQNAAHAARCAAEQNKFWAYHDKLYANPAAQDLVSLNRYAAEIGLDTVRFQSCMSSNRYRTHIQADMEQGLQAGVRGTPTFFLNGHKAEGPLPADKLEALLLKFPEATSPKS